MSNKDDLTPGFTSFRKYIYGIVAMATDQAHVPRMLQISLQIITGKGLVILMPGTGAERIEIGYGNIYGWYVGLLN